MMMSPASTFISSILLKMSICCPSSKPENSILFSIAFFILSIASGAFGMIFLTNGTVPAGGRSLSALTLPRRLLPRKPGGYSTARTGKESTVSPPENSTEQKENEWVSE